MTRATSLLRRASLGACFLSWAASVAAVAEAAQPEAVAKPGAATDRRLAQRKRSTAPASWPRVQTLVAVVVRYASLDDASLLAVAMDKTESTAIAAVEAHLSELVAVLIGAEHRPPWQPASAVIRFARQSTSLPT